MTIEEFNAHETDYQRMIAEANARAAHRQELFVSTGDPQYAPVRIQTEHRFWTDGGTIT